MNTLRAALLAGLLTACGSSGGGGPASAIPDAGGPDAAMHDAVVHDAAAPDAAIADAALPDAAVPDPEACGTDGARATCLAPTQTPEYYVEQGLKYFDTLAADADPESHPVYAELVARWEWPPWLKLTGYGRELIASIDKGVLGFYPETTVPIRDCQAFTVQPFSRCHVSIDYGGRGCPIYEEFTFNDAGEVTFIEAWSDLPDLPTAAPDDRWAEAPDAHRLSTRVPGLGTPSGRIDPTGPAMTAAAASDPELADFVARTQDFWKLWGQEFRAAGSGLYARGCGW